MDKLHTITENITKHDDRLFMAGGKLKTGLNCLHNFNNEKRHYIKSGVEKDVLHLVEDLHRLMAKYNATYQIGTKSSTSEARKRKEYRKKGEKRKLATCENGREKACLIFRFLGGVALSEDFEPDIFGIPHTGKQLNVKAYICLPQRQTGHAYATFVGQTCLGFYT